MRDNTQYAYSPPASVTGDAPGTPEAAAAQQKKDMELYFPEEKTPVSVISTDRGKKILDEQKATQESDMEKYNKLFEDKGNRLLPGEKNASANAFIKSLGGVTAEEAKVAGIDLSGYEQDKASGYFLPTGALMRDKAKDKAELDLINATAMMDAANKATVDSIRGIYEQRFADAREENQGDEAVARGFALRYGRYAPSAKEVLTRAETAGIQRLSRLSTDESKLIAEANQNLADKKYQLFVQKRNELNEIRKEQVSELNKLRDRAYTEQKKQDDRKQQASIDKAVADKISKGIIDPKEILSALNKEGGTYTAKEIADSIKSLNPLGDIDKLSSDARDFFILKQSGGQALPASITSLPEDQQLLAYMRMKHQATTRPPATPAGDRLSLSEAKSIGLPVSLVGMSEQEILTSLELDEPPQWFLDYMVKQGGGNEVISASSSINYSLWDQFRREILANTEKTDKATARERASGYFSETYGDTLDEEEIGALADRVDLYVQGGMTYAKAVQKVTTEASQ